MAKPSRLLLIGALVLGTVACSSDDDAASDTTAATSAAAPETTAMVDTTSADGAGTSATLTTDAPTTTEAPTTTAALEPLTILVTNDDGIGAGGIDAVVNALTAMENVEVIVIAPLTQQSGTSDNMTDGALTVTDATTASGFPAKAVAGFPADTIIYAFDQGGLTEAPDLVVSGINEGQNVGPVVGLSGTIGAARTSAKRGVPSIASSQQVFTTADGVSVEPQYEVTAEVVVAWIEQNFENLLAGTMPPYVYNINGASCLAGTVREVVTVPLAIDGAQYGTPSDCVTEPAAPPTDDIDALVKGYVSYTEMDPETLLQVN